MTSDDNRILEKIKKCLALAQSSNPHEAAAALRQAQAMMEKHGIEHADVELSEIGKFSTNASGGKTVAQWEHRLVKAVADTFGVVPLFSDGKTVVWRTTWRDKAGNVVSEKKRRATKRGEIVFVGRKNRAEVAVYAYQSLRRQLDAARKAYRKECLALTVTQRSKKSSRIDSKTIDVFCAAWAVRATSKLAVLAIPFEEADRISRYMEREMNVADTETRNRPISQKSDKLTQHAIVSGLIAGSDAILHAGVGSAQSTLQLEVV